VSKPQERWFLAPCGGLQSNEKDPSFPEQLFLMEQVQSGYKGSSIEGKKHYFSTPVITMPWMK
jgi:hypothetical protein